MNSTTIDNFTRHDERIKVMQAFYQIFFHLENGTEYDAQEILSSLYSVTDYSSCPVFSQVVYALGLEHFDEIKSLISSHLVNWTFSRVDNLAKAILFLGIAEGKFLKKTPRNVVINEAVKLAKAYLKEGDYRFINAVLDKVVEGY